MKRSVHIPSQPYLSPGACRLRSEPGPLEAAEVASRLELRELIPDVAAAFLRLLGEGAAADKG
jgi:hypothetical protein